MTGLYAALTALADELLATNDQHDRSDAAYHDSGERIHALLAEHEPPGDDSDVETGRCCPHCRQMLTEHNRAVWEAGYAIGQRHTRDEQSTPPVPPGPCWHDSGITWPSGERPRCELLAGHAGAHAWKRPNGGEAVWTDTAPNEPSEGPPPNVLPTQDDEPSETVTDALTESSDEDSDTAPSERCPDCGHAPHGSIGFCPNMASDNDCPCASTYSTTPSERARLTDEEKRVVWHAWHDAPHFKDLVKTRVDEAYERILAARLAQVTWERDEARAAHAKAVAHGVTVGEAYERAVDRAGALAEQVAAIAALVARWAAEAPVARTDQAHAILDCERAIRAALASPGSVLAARDAKVAAQAWDEGAIWAGAVRLGGTVSADNPYRARAAGGEVDRG